MKYNTVMYIYSRNQRVHAPCDTLLQYFDAFIHFNPVLIDRAYELVLPYHRLRSSCTVSLNEKVRLIRGKRR